MFVIGRLTQDVLIGKRKRLKMIEFCLFRGGFECLQLAEDCGLTLGVD
jgi:hypothetical protein